MDRFKILVLITVLLVGAAFGWYFYQQKHNGKLTASGTIEGTEVTVSSKVTGKVSVILVDEGLTVNEGDVLASIEAEELGEALKSAQARYKIAKDDLDRSQQLYRDRMISQQQYEGAGSSLDIAAAALEIARLQVENTTITAPISGIVLVKAIERGELATIGSPIATLADLTKVKLTVYLPEQNIGQVNLGEEVKISVDSFPGAIFAGRVVYISDRAEFTPKSIQTKEERTTQVFAIRIEIPNPELKLKPGMPADAEFPWTSR
ncbi:MAG: efflux RND transporter periplasmic adaptor subunit [Candidatus Margulisiibacteriota bacterium]|jgi:RND family efflux transporter MFP subunit